LSKPDNRWLIINSKTNYTQPSKAEPVPQLNGVTEPVFSQTKQKKVEHAGIIGRTYTVYQCACGRYTKGFVF
jgi:hypothetical protein